jgi:prepilin-type processing-associated H-X9-DG protein
MLHLADVSGRFPACGNFTTTLGRHHNWVLDVLPWLGEDAIAAKWRREQPADDPVNDNLSRTHIAILACPSDSSATGHGDLSYVVSGGVGFTAFLNGVHDCPCNTNWFRLDLNGNGVVCPMLAKADGYPSDRDFLLRMGLFFNETLDFPISRRHHSIATVLDGASNTVSLSENVRTGYDSATAGASPIARWSSPDPLLTSFYIGTPCLGGTCLTGQVDYSRANSGDAAINSGLRRPDGESAVPNSFHTQGVNMSFVDGHVQFVSENIDGSVYASIVSPQGAMLKHTALEQLAPPADY